MRTRYIVVLSMLLLAAAGGAARAAESFVQDRFAIGLWVDPPLDANADARYRELAEANFTLVIGGFGGTGIEKVSQQMALCEKYDLRLIAPSHAIAPEDLPDGPAIWGYALRDEPSAADFPELRTKADAIRAVRPGKLTYINLFPNYASEKQLGTSTYDEHVRLFVETLQPSVLSMDHYPIFRPSGDGRDAYCETLVTMRQYALANNIPFWNFFNIMPYGPHTDPTEGQVRWQIFTSLAYGAKGVLYFCYYTPAGGEFPKGGAIIARDGRRTRHYDEARRINAELKNLGPTLMQLTSTGVYRVSEEAGDDPETVLKGAPLVNISRDDHDPPHDYLIGVFRHADGRRAVLLNNYRFAYTAWPTVVFDVPAEQVIEVDRHTGEMAPVIDDSPDMDGLQVSLGAGDGRLFLLP